MEVILVFASVVSLVVGQKCRSTVDQGIRWTVDCSVMNLSAAPPPVIIHPVVALNLSDNVFTHLTESLFVNWTDILHLDLSFNIIKIVDSDSFKGLGNLTELNLMNNQIEVLSPNITNHLPKLRVLNLSSNKLRTITPGTFKPVSTLLKLFLGSNAELGKISENYNILNESLTQGLITLDLTNISLTQLSNTFFKDADHLITLKIGQNPLKNIPDLPPSLRHLNFSGTLIDTVPEGTFSKSDLLQRLSLESMPLLKNIKANAFKGLQHLEELYITDCLQLSFISGDVFGEDAPNLKKVVISRCALTSLPKTFKTMLSKVEYLDLQNNPWICDGRILWLADEHIPSNLTENLRCDKPEAAQGMLLTEYFKPRSLHPYYSLIRAGIVIAMVALLVASVVGMIRHMRKEKPKIYHQLHDIRLQDRTPTSLPPL